MQSIPRIFKFSSILGAALIWACGATPALAASIFANDTLIDIPDTGTSGIAAPYPSTIGVSAMLGTVTKVTVSLHDFSHTYPNDVAAVVVGPQGDKVKLMLDSGSGVDADNLNFTFDDDAATEIPGTGALSSGTFRPESGGTLSGACSPMPGPYPAGPLGSALSAFNGKDPNGAWSLYVCDQSGSDTGDFAGGWSLSFEGATRVNLESPSAGSAESGIGLIRGWACDGTRVDVQIDGGRNLEMPYGTSRPDTAAACGDDDNGFGGVVNWNRLGDGLHTLKAFVDTVEFASVNFTVTTLGQEYLTGVSGEFTEFDFPDTGYNLTMKWSEPHQNFVFVGSGSSGGNPGDTQGDGTTARLESPFSGSSESGIGIIRGWACDATKISILIDSDPLIEASYGAERLDTQGVCGDSDNGFGVVVNWNLYATGVHRLRAYIDDSTTAFADVTFNVFNIGTGYLTGVGSPTATFSDFPAAGGEVEVTWSEPHQGVVITDYTAP
jgi:subtilisin-like proprotein convertase family protein